jgi:hypothetical protein
MEQAAAGCPRQRLDPEKLDRLEGSPTAAVDGTMRQVCDIAKHKGGIKPFAQRPVFREARRSIERAPRRSVELSSVRRA